MKKNRRFIVCGLLLYVCIGMIGIFITSYGADKQTEETTTEYVSTISKIIITGTGENPIVQIYTQEYDHWWSVPESIIQYMGVPDNLKIGDQIIVRVENIDKEVMGEADFIRIVSLSREKEVVFSLEDYNKYTGIGMDDARLGMIICSIISIVVFLNYSKLLKRVKYKRKPNKQ